MIFYKHIDIQTAMTTKTNNHLHSHEDIPKGHFYPSIQISARSDKAHKETGNFPADSSWEEGKTGPGSSNTTAETMKGQ